MLNFNADTLQTVIDTALTNAADHPRWITAIQRAARELESNPYIEWIDGHLLIATTEGNLYAANGVCQCKAFEFGNPCWHRAAARLVRRYHEALLVAKPKVSYQRALAEMNELFA